jgi:hypothetical protein
MMGPEGSAQMQVSSVRRRVWQPGIRQHEPGRRPLASVCVPAALAFSSLLVLSACSGSPKPLSDAGKQCGTGRSPANVPISIEVDRGYVACGTAMTVEKNYATAIDEGKAPGEGGGGPVPVNGWICEGFPTPVVLKTGDASKCTKGSNEILAILPTTS